MARRVFYSFHYRPDNWRAAKVRNIGAIEGNKPASDNDWETIRKGGDERIKKWIADQMDGTSCTVVLIGANTAGRTWIKYEIKKTWDDNKGVVGVYVHNLQDSEEKQSSKGSNPFDSVDYTGHKPQLFGRSIPGILSSIVKAYDPPYTVSTDVYKYISDNLAGWIDEAIKIREKN